MSNRGIGRARLFMGALLFLAALITWGTSLTMSPHAEPTGEGAEHMRTSVVLFVRNSSLGTLVLCALAGWLLFPSRRPKRPVRDWATIGLITLMVLSSLYQLFWLRKFAVQ